MTRSVVWLAVVCVLGGPANLSAQEPLTIERAWEEARTHNPSLRASRAARDEASARRSAAEAAWWPRVSFAESWQRADQPVFAFSSLLSARRFSAPDFAIERLNHPDPVSLFRASIGIDHMVYDGGRRRSATTEAAAREEIASAGAAMAEGDVFVAVAEAFGRTIAADASRRSAEAALAAVRESRASAQRRRDAGLATDADVLALAAHEASLEARGIQAAGDLAVAQAQLNRWLGAPIDRRYQPVEPAMIPEIEGTLPALLAEAERARPVLRAAAAAGRRTGRGGARAGSQRADA